MPARIWRAVFEGFLDDEAAGGLSRIEVPTLLTWGDRDAFCSRADQDALLGAIRGSRLTVYSGAGHALHWEEPARFASDVAAFCASLAPRAATANAG
jgi:pimeloyl-ACP methyl ester carboxylesterase